MAVMISKVVSSPVESLGPDDSFGMTESEKLDLLEQRTVNRLERIKLYEVSDDEDLPSQPRVSQDRGRAKRMLAAEAPYKRKANVRAVSADDVEDFTEAMDIQSEEDISETEEVLEMPVAKTTRRHTSLAILSETEDLEDDSQESGTRLRNHEEPAKKIGRAHV